MRTVLINCCLDDGVDVEKKLGDAALTAEQKQVVRRVVHTEVEILQRQT